MLCPSPLAVEFPDAVTPEQAAALTAAFGGAPANGAAPMADEVEEVGLAPVKDIEAEIKQRREYDRRSGGGDESDSDDEGPRRHVQCAQS